MSSLHHSEETHANLVARLPEATGKPIDDGKIGAARGVERPCDQHAAGIGTKIDGGEFLLGNPLAPPA